jgi:acyl dehydratase
MLNIGDFYELELSFTQAQVDAFAEVTDDKNPLHIDVEYAKTTRFGRTVVHGFLAGAVFSRIFGTLFPGEGTIYIYQDMRFREPVFVDTPYKARVEVTEINREKHNGVVICLLLNEKAEPEHRICIEGTARMKHLEKF